MGGRRRPASVDATVAVPRAVGVAATHVVRCTPYAKVLASRAHSCRERFPAHRSPPWLPVIEVLQSPRKGRRRCRPEERQEQERQPLPASRASSRSEQQHRHGLLPVRCWHKSTSPPRRRQRRRRQRRIKRDDYTRR